MKPEEATIRSNTHWHSISVSEVSDVLHTDPNRGLDSHTASLRQAEVGPNVLTVSKGQHWIFSLLLQFHQSLIYILLASALVTAIMKNPVDALVIVAVVVLNAIISFVQETNAVKAIDALVRDVVSEATLVRDGVTNRLSYLFNCRSLIRSMFSLGLFSNRWLLLGVIDQGRTAVGR